MNLDDAYAVNIPQDSRKLYATWAATYDETFIKANDYVYPRTIALHFDMRVSKSEVNTVVDIGCGTGAVGSYLANLRPACAIDGFDISPEMLACAAQLQRIDESAVYRELVTVDLTESLPNRSYDAMTSAGTFTHGHLGAETLISLIRLVRVGGWFVIGINAKHFSSQGFANTLDLSRNAGTISKPDIEQVQIYGPAGPHFGDLANITTFQRLQ